VFTRNESAWRVNKRGKRKVTPSNTTTTPSPPPRNDYTNTNIQLDRNSNSDAKTRTQHNPQGHKISLKSPSKDSYKLLCLSSLTITPACLHVTKVHGMSTKELVMYERHKWLYLKPDELRISTIHLQELTKTTTSPTTQDNHTHIYNIYILYIYAIYIFYTYPIYTHRHKYRAETTRTPYSASTWYAGDIEDVQETLRL